MFENATMDILMKFLDRKVNEAAEEVTQKGTLSEDKAIPLMLKMQFNHIAHLEESVNDRFGQINQKFEQVDRRFEQIDQRFEQIDHKFERVDQRFDQILGDMNGRFAQITNEMNARFAQITNEMNGRFRHMERMALGGFTFLSFLIAAMRFVK